MKSLSSCLAALFLLTILAIPAQSQGQDYYMDQVFAQLEAASDTYANSGYDALVRESGALNDGQSDSYNVNLITGNTYAIVAVCDEDCSDIDMRLRDWNGNLIVEDTQTDDVPIVEFEVYATGEFDLEVTLYECSSEPCYYGVALFRAPNYPAAAAAGASGTSRIESDNPYEEQIFMQLDAVSEMFTSEGYDTIVWESDMLNESDSELYSVDLNAGSSYALVGVCDEDCSDIDLTLYDWNDNLIVEDTETDDVPILRFNVYNSGQFTLDVTMFQCSSEPCYFGVALLEY